MTYPEFLDTPDETTQPHPAPPRPGPPGFIPVGVSDNAARQATLTSFDCVICHPEAHAGCGCNDRCNDHRIGTTDRSRPAEHPFGPDCSEKCRRDAGEAATWDAEPPADVLARSAADIKTLSAQADISPPITPERLKELVTAARGQLVGIGRLAMSQKERLIADLADALVAVTAPPRWVMAHTDVTEATPKVTAGQPIGFVGALGGIGHVGSGTGERIERVGYGATAHDLLDAERRNAVIGLIAAAEGDDITALDRATERARRAFRIGATS